MQRLNLSRILPIFIAIAAGCTTAGTGVGYTVAGGRPTTFSWKSADIVSGTMTATLSDGTTFSGQYFQITPDTDAPGIASLYEGANPSWEETNSGAGPWRKFNENLAHRAVANLASVKGLQMKCMFQLVYPPNGMYGGGTGTCQLPDGKIIDARFPPT